MFFFHLFIFSHRRFQHRGDAGTDAHALASTFENSEELLGKCKIGKETGCAQGTRQERHAKDLASAYALLQLARDCGIDTSPRGWRAWLEVPADGAHWPWRLPPPPARRAPEVEVRAITRVKGAFKAPR